MRLYLYSLKIFFFHFPSMIWFILRKAYFTVVQITFVSVRFYFILFNGLSRFPCTSLSRLDWPIVCLPQIWYLMFFVTTLKSSWPFNISQQTQVHNKHNFLNYLSSLSIILRFKSSFSKGLKMNFNILFVWRFSLYIQLWKKNAFMRCIEFHILVFNIYTTCKHKYVKTGWNHFDLFGTVDVLLMFIRTHKNRINSSTLVSHNKWPCTAVGSQSTTNTFVG